MIPCRLFYNISSLAAAGIAKTAVRHGLCFLPSGSFDEYSLDLHGSVLITASVPSALLCMSVLLKCLPLHSITKLLFLNNLWETKAKI